jgi:hypothetical protein
LKPSAENYWLYASGAVIPHGSTTTSFNTYPNIKLLSVEGERWTSENKTTRASAYYALVILPQVSLRENGSVSGGDGKTQISTLKWLRESNSAGNYQSTKERDLAVTYDAIFQTMRIDTESYSLSKGNLFVIRLDEEWQLQVTQLNTIVSGDDEFEARKYFKGAVPDEEAVQKYF